MSDQTPAAKRPAHRPRIDPSGPQVRKSVKLAPAEIDHLTRRYGGVHAGLRTLTRRDMAAGEQPGNPGEYRDTPIVPV